MAPVPSSCSSGRVLGPLPVGERNWGGSRKISRAQSHHAGHMQDLINSQSSLFQPYLAWGPLECPETWDWLASLLEKDYVQHHEEQDSYKGCRGRNRETLGSFQDHRRHTMEGD